MAPPGGVCERPELPGDLEPPPLMLPPDPEPPLGGVYGRPPELCEGDFPSESTFLRLGGFSLHFPSLDGVLLRLTCLQSVELLPIPIPALLAPLLPFSSFGRMWLCCNFTLGSPLLKSPHPAPMIRGLCDPPLCVSGISEACPKIVLAPPLLAPKTIPISNVSLREGSGVLCPCDVGF